MSELHSMNGKVTALTEVFHIGTLDHADKGKLTWSDSYEGHGLSVSLHPDEWERIAKLGGLPRWKLTNEAGRFLDALELSDTQRKEIIAWGVEQGLCEVRTVWTVARYDDELEDTMLISFEDEETARAEAEDSELDPDAVASQQRPQATPALRDRVGCDSGADCFDHLTVVWVEDNRPDLDGVWWRFEHAPMSAPAGTILPGKLALWRRERTS